MTKRGLLSGGYLTGETQAPTALCLAPTRELAVQIHREVCKFANETVVTAAVCYGGVSVRHQADKIRRGCHFLVATPGRLIDFVDSNRVCNIHFCTNCAISLAVGNCKTVGVFPHLFFPFVFCLSMFLSSFFFSKLFFFEFLMFTLAPELSLLRAVLQTVRKFFPYLYLIIVLLVSFAADQFGKRTLFDPG